MKSVVYAAAMEGKTEILITTIAQIDQERTPHNNTVLHIAAQYGQTEYVQELLAKMDSSKLSMLLPAVNQKGDTALHIAARGGHSLIIRALIMRSKELDQEEPENGLNIVKEILTSVNEDGDTAFHEALRSSIGNPRSDEEKPSIRGAEDGPGTTAPVPEGDEPVVRRMVTLKRILTGDWKHEPPRQAVQVTALEDVTMLMYPDFPYLANKAGETPLYLAAECEFNQLVSKMVNNVSGDESNAADYGGPGDRTALHAAIISNNEENTESLLKWNNDLARKTDVQGWAPLHYAAEFGHAERVTQLLGFDESLGYQTTGDEDGKDTAIHIAARQGHVAVLEQLVSGSAGCWDVANAKGQNLLHVAVESKKPDVIKFFKQSPSLGSLLNRKDNDGNTPLHIAARDRRVLEYLSGADYSVLDKTSLNRVNRSPLGHGPPQEKKATRERKAGVSQDAVVKSSGEQKTGHQAHDKKKEKSRAQFSGQGKPEITDMFEDQIDESRRGYMERVRSTHLLVATFVATTTFAAGMSMSGGYNGKEGPNQGVPLLLKQAAFKAFAVTDVLAMVFSTSAMLLYMGNSVETDFSLAVQQFWAATALNQCSVTLMVVAFATGSYAVLTHLPALAITMLVFVSIYCSAIYCFVGKI